MASSPLSQRPLKSGDPLYVARFEAETSLKRALSLGLNVTVLGPPGVGKTTLVRQAVAEYSTPPTGRLIWIDAIGCSTNGLVNRIAEGFGWSRPTSRWQAKPLSALASFLGDEIPIEPDPDSIEPDEVSFLARQIDEAPESLELSSEAQASTDVWLVVLDAPPPLAFDEFWGKHRERLWELPVQWVVLSTRSLLPLGADLFFDSTIVLDELDAESAKAVVISRLEATGQVSLGRAQRLADAVVGQIPSRPRDLIAAARDALLHTNDAEARYARYSRLTEQAAVLGRPHAMLMAELIAANGAHASDEDLQHRLGYSRPRLVQLLDELSTEKLVTRRRDGRRVIFAPADEWP